MGRTATGMPSIGARAGRARAETRALPEEVPVAVVYDGTTQAVMMASPADLEDFALGFALTDHAIERVSEVESLEIAEQPRGIEARLWLAPHRRDAVAERRRRMAGPVGCGLCGIDSLAEALRPVAPVAAEGPRLAGAEVTAAVASLRARQPLHDLTRAVHAAGLHVPGEGLVLVREDVGRHNALDKLVGAAARAGHDMGRGAVVLTSRVSVDMVQKAARGGAALILAVSAPTAEAVRLAGEAGITVAGLVRGSGFEIFTHPRRIDLGDTDDVA